MVKKCLLRFKVNVSLDHDYYSEIQMSLIDTNYIRAVKKIAE